MSSGIMGKKIYRGTYRILRLNLEVDSMIILKIGNSLKSINIEGKIYDEIKKKKQYYNSMMGALR